MSNIPLVTHEVDPSTPPNKLVYTFGGYGPVGTLTPPMALSTSTLDAFGGALTSPDQLPSQVIDSRYLNPQTGPFYIEGAEPGDTLAVHFRKITPRSKYGISATIPYFGALTSTPETATLQAPLDEKVWFYELDTAAGLVQFKALDSAFTAALPMDPMHGTVGVAPPLQEVRSSLAPGSWGGNMDTPEMRAGATCYLGVNVEGAMFSFGDGHARQGEGESCGVAVECAMDSVVVVDLIKGYYTPWPRIETDDYIMTTGSSKPMEDAFRIAHTEMVRWVGELTELSTLDAYQFITQTVETPVANACDKVYTVVCKLSKRYLPNISVFDNKHRRLRQGSH